MTKLSDNVAGRIRDLRVVKGWSQERLAEAAGLSRDAVSRIERGDRSARLETLDLIAHALGTSLPKLLDFEEPLPRHQPRDERLLGLQHWLDQLDPEMVEALMSAVHRVAQAARQQARRTARRRTGDRPKKSGRTPRRR